MQHNQQHEAQARAAQQLQQALQLHQQQQQQQLALQQQQLKSALQQHQAATAVVTSQPMVQTMPTAQQQQQQLMQQRMQQQQQQPQMMMPQAQIITQARPQGTAVMPATGPQMQMHQRATPPPGPLQQAAKPIVGFTPPQLEVLKSQIMLFKQLKQSTQIQPDLIQKCDPALAASSVVAAQQANIAANAAANAAAAAAAAAKQAQQRKAAAPKPAAKPTSAAKPTNAAANRPAAAAAPALPTVLHRPGMKLPPAVRRLTGPLETFQPGFPPDMGATGMLAASEQMSVNFDVARLMQVGLLGCCRCGPCICGGTS